MKREIITTNDGSKTIHLPEWNEQYHSIHGAVQEALHVYLKEGLAFFLASESCDKKSNTTTLLEIGFGTGLNALLTLAEAEKQQIQINYTGVEGFPISLSELEQLNYAEAVDLTNSAALFDKLHRCDWEKDCAISEHFQLKKQRSPFSEINYTNQFNLIYFDAFGPRVQPELWTEVMFNAMYKALKPKGVLVTYCAQGHARRAMMSAGFTVEKVNGPPGKRHMLRAVKK